MYDLRDYSSVTGLAPCLAKRARFFFFVDISHVDTELISTLSGHPPVPSTYDRERLDSTLQKRSDTRL